MHFFRAGFLALGLMASTFINADTSVADVDALINKLSYVETVEGKASQIITTLDGDLIQETESEFKILRPGYFYWRTLPPYEQVIVSNPKTLSVYDPDLEQVSIYQSEKMQNSPASILSGNREILQRQFKVKALEGKNKHQSIYSLQYLNTDEADFKTLNIAFNKDKLESVVLVDMLDQTTTIKFKKVNTKAKLTPAMFEFVPPEGSDVIVE